MWMEVVMAWLEELSVWNHMERKSYVFNKTSGMANFFPIVWWEEIMIMSWSVSQWHTLKDILDKVYSLNFCLEGPN
jgi:hypothetical protein